MIHLYPNISGALAREAPSVRKCGKLPIRENVVITWPWWKWAAVKKKWTRKRRTFQSMKTCNSEVLGTFTLQSCKRTAKKCTRKVRCTCKVPFLLISYTILYFVWTILSRASLLALPKSMNWSSIPWDEFVPRCLVVWPMRRFADVPECLYNSFFQYGTLKSDTHKCNWFFQATNFD